MIHPLPPVCGKDSRVLLLGTMPSPKSREAGFYYAHPRNRFWTVLAQIFEEPAPEGTDARRAFCLRHRIALWDVLASCVIAGASDSSIREPKANPIAEILESAPLRRFLRRDEKRMSFTIGFACRKQGKRLFCFRLPARLTALARCPI